MSGVLGQAVPGKTMEEMGESRKSNKMRCPICSEALSKIEKNAYVTVGHYNQDRHGFEREGPVDVYWCYWCKKYRYIENEGIMEYGVKV
jgi:uncharacterized protein with PIN domain